MIMHPQVVQQASRLMASSCLPRNIEGLKERRGIPHRLHLANGALVFVATPHGVPSWRQSNSCASSSLFWMFSMYPWKSSSGFRHPVSSIYHYSGFDLEIQNSR
jgi:hypothetical protein